MIIPSIWENKKCSKPPTSISFVRSTIGIIHHQKKLVTSSFHKIPQEYGSYITELSQYHEVKNRDLPWSVTSCISLLASPGSIRPGALVAFDHRPAEMRWPRWTKYLAGAVEGPASFSNIPRGYAQSRILLIGVSIEITKFHQKS